jgi:hypothetical protein
MIGMSINIGNLISFINDVKTLSSKQEKMTKAKN